ncbi:MAG: hypothetical protein QHJ82_07650 [Verrucomicrobiota bacterium]|nr:hypothetical protein [Verrucomicrobiota bacterium]
MLAKILTLRVWSVSVCLVLWPSGGRSQQHGLLGDADMGTGTLFGHPCHPRHPRSNSSNEHKIESIDHG